MQTITCAVPTESRWGLEPPPRLVDAAILVLVAFEVGSGLVSLLVGTPDAGWLFVLHGIAGLSLVLLLFWKLRRVRGRVLRWGDWPRRTVVSVLLTVVAVAALLTGLAWTLLDLVRVEGFTLLVVHMVLGVLAVPILCWHLRHRLRLPTTSDLEGRRTSLQFGGVLVGSALAWRGKEVIGGILGLAGSNRRFTGSKQTGGQGNGFPVTSWVADDPNPVDVDDWRLTVAGAVVTPASVRYEALIGSDQPPAGDSEPSDARTGASGTGAGARERLDATLDCTSGWYAERTWTGVSLDRLLEAVGTTDEAGWIRIRSVTGYRWSFPIEEAEDLLLATHVDGEPLHHGHGAPVRLVAPGRRGFQWVKWVDRVDVTASEDLSQWVAIFVSGFD
jgi:hypothetical protein